MDPIRVLIVADDPLVRAGLAALLADRDGCVVVGQIAAEPHLIDVYRPDALLWDLGWDADQEFEFSDLPPVVALLPDDQTLAASIWAAGARGLLPRTAGPDTMIAALGAVLRGLAVFDPALVAALSLIPADALPADLTPREIEVLRLLAEGLANKAIARQLDISEHTVKFHINALLGKLGAQSRTEAVVTAIRRGMISV